MDEGPLKTRWEQNQPTSRQRIMFGAILFLPLCGIKAIITLGYQAYSSWAETRRSTDTQYAFLGAAAITAEVAEATAGFRVRTAAVEKAKAASPYKGQAGMAIGLSNEGEAVFVAFDNFELRGRVEAE